jgi:stage II sporulation protein M
VTGREFDAGSGGQDPLGRRLAARLRDFYGREWAMWKAHYKKYFKIAVRALGLGFILGFIVFIVRPDLERRGLAYVMKSLRDIPLGAPPPEMALELFYHNARASAVAVAAGLVPFACLPALDPLANGAALGLLASVSKRRGFDVPLLFLKSVAPHGIFELPAVLYASSVGIYLSLAVGRWLLAALRRRKKNREREKLPVEGRPEPAAGASLECSAGRAEASPADFVGDAARSFALVVLPLLLVAAFVEAFITPMLR